MQTRTDYQPRYIAYCNFNNKSPEEMMIADKIEFPGGRTAGFILWITSAWSLWEKETKRFKPHGDQDHIDFDQWLTKYSKQGV